MQRYLLLLRSRSITTHQILLFCQMVFCEMDLLGVNCFFQALVEALLSIGYSLLMSGFNDVQIFDVSVKNLMHVGTRRFLKP